MYLPLGTDVLTFHLVQVLKENSSIQLAILNKSFKFDRIVVISSLITVIMFLNDEGRLSEVNLRIII